MISGHCLKVMVNALTEDAESHKRNLSCLTGLAAGSWLVRAMVNGYLLVVRPLGRQSVISGGLMASQSDGAVPFWTTVVGLRL